MARPLTPVPCSAQSRRGPETRGHGGPGVMPGCGGTPGGGTGSSHRQRRLRAGPDRLACRLGQGLLGAARRGAHDRRRQVEIGGSPAVTLGGDFWHTTSYPLGANNFFLIRAVTKAPGILDSVPFKVSRRFLVFRLGGSRDKGAAIELRVTPKAAERAGLKALDKPDAEGYVAVKVATPAGSDVAQGDRLGPRPGGRQDADRPGREGPPAPRRRRQAATPPARRLRPPRRARSRRSSARRCGAGPTSTAIPWRRRGSAS